MTALALNLTAANVRCGNKKGNMETKTDDKPTLRAKIKAIREGHLTGGYCDTDALRAEQKKLWHILDTELEAARAKHGYSPDPKFKHPVVRGIELELNGLSYQPKMVAAKEDAK